MEMMTALQEVNLKVLKQEDLKFDELLIYMNGNRVYEYIKSINFIFRADKDGNVKVIKDFLSPLVKFKGTATNSDFYFNNRTTGHYSVEGENYTFENLIPYVESLFVEVLVQESVHGHTDEVTVIYHESSERYLRCFYNYQSYQGYVYDECNWHEVTPHKIERIEYTYVNKK